MDVSHVVTLRNMIARNTNIPHEMTCITDSEESAKALSAENIRAVPIDWTKHVPGTCYVRLMLRRPDIGGLLGRRFFQCDLDVVITGNIDHILSRPEENVYWRNPNFGLPQRAYYQTSFQLITAGTLPELWNDFDPSITPTWVNRRFGGREQAYISERLGFDMPVWTEEDGIYGAGRLFGKTMDAGITGELPSNACIVSFPGDRAPWQKELQEKQPWIRDFYI